MIEFLEFTERKLLDNKGIYLLSMCFIRDYKKTWKGKKFKQLCCDGIFQHYTTWAWNGEVKKELNRVT